MVMYNHCSNLIKSQAFKKIRPASANSDLTVFCKVWAIPK